MRSLFPQVTSLTIPSGAVPGESRIVIGPDLPAPLAGTTFSLLGSTFTYSSGIIFYGTGDDTTYTYLCATNFSVGVQQQVHMGEVRSGAVRSDANGDVLVQAWIDAPAGVTHLLHPSVWEAIVGVTPNVGIISISPLGLITVQSVGSNILLQANASDINLVAGDDIGLSATGDIDLAAGGTMDIDASPRVGPAGSEQDAYVPYDPEAADCSASVAINVTTPATAVAITGCTKTINVISASDVFWVTGCFDVRASAAPTAGFDGVLYVDANIQNGHATFQTTVINHRTTTTRVWKVTGLSPGNHTFELRGYAGVAAQYAVQATNTTMDVDPRYHK